VALSLSWLDRMGMFRLASLRRDGRGARRHMGWWRCCQMRSLTRRTNFNPDQISVTAQTFTSTKPAASPISRTRFSSRSDATPELFFGQLTHSIPAGCSNFAKRRNSCFSSACDLVKRMAKSRGSL